VFESLKSTTLQNEFGFYYSRVYVNVECKVDGRVFFHGKVDLRRDTLSKTSRKYFLREKIEDEAC